MYMKRFMSVVIGLGGLGLAGHLLAADLGVGAAASKALAPESCQIRNKKFGELLRPEDANSADGTRLVLYPAQLWKCMTWKMHPAGESAFQLQNHFTSKTFAPAAKVDGRQAAVSQVPFSRETRERPTWRFTQLPDGLYQITDTKSGQALTAVASDGGGVRIVVAPCTEGDAQKWEVQKIDPAKLTM
jgi:hypothetical protein